MDYFVNSKLFYNTVFKIAKITIDCLFSSKIGADLHMISIKIKKAENK